MSKVADCEVFSVDELTEVLAETTGTPVEDIDKGQRRCISSSPSKGLLLTSDGRSARRPTAGSDTELTAF